MGYIKKKIGDISNVPYVTFECDTVADLAAIDVSNVVMGSRCYVVDTGATYALNSNGEWKEVPIGGGVSSWNDLEDKPFYEETVTNVIPGLNITWDGAMEGDTFKVGPMSLYRVYDIPPLEQLQNAVFEVGLVSTGKPNGDIFNFSQFTTYQDTEQVFIARLSNLLVFAVVYDESYGYPTGLYLSNNYSMFIHSVTAPAIENTVTEIKTIDKKFLPESLQFGMEKHPVNLQWDGNKDGKEVAIFNGGYIDLNLYKVSDKVFTVDELKNITVIGSTRPDPLELYEEPQDASAQIGVPCTLICVSGINTSFNPALISVGDAINITDEYSKAIFPSAGTYLADMSDPMWDYDGQPVGYITSVKGEDVVKTIDPKYLPDNIGGVSSVNGVEPDENGNIQLPEGFSGEWDDLKNRPFYDETITTVIKGLDIQWDGDFTDLPSMPASGMDKSYRVSDATPTIEELKKATIVYTYSDGEEESYSLATFDSIRKNTAQILHVVKRHHIMVVYDESYGYPTGLYLPYVTLSSRRQKYASSLISPDETETVTNFKALDEKFLPEGTVTSNNISEYLPDDIGGSTTNLLIDVENNTYLCDIPLADFFAKVDNEGLETVNISVGKQNQHFCKLDTYRDGSYIRCHYLTPGYTGEAADIPMLMFNIVYLYSDGRVSVQSKGSFTGQNK